jgi:hypothetical protein
MFPTGQHDLGRLRGLDPPARPGEHPNDASSSSGKKKFTEQEDNYLTHLVGVHGTHNWKAIAWHMNGRTVRQCRERFKYYLEPGIKRPVWTDDEDRLLMDRYATIGPKWAQIAAFFNGRTDIDLKNRYQRLQRAMKPSKKHGWGDLVNVENRAISGFHVGSDLQTARPQLPSLTPGVDFVGLNTTPPLTNPVRPRRIICSNQNVQKGTDRVIE